MNIEIIKKLIESSNEDDVKLGMIYLSKHIEKNGVGGFSINRENMAPEAVGILDFNPKLSGWFLVVNHKNKFCINVGHIRDKKRNQIIYGLENRYTIVLSSYKDEIIHEDD